MQLAITALGNNSTHFITPVLDAVSSCQCNVVSLKSSCLAQATASYLLVTGNWNQIVKLETILDNLQQRLEIHIHTLRADITLKKTKFIPYSLESISLTHNNIIKNLSTFLLDREIDIEDINAGYHQTSYIQNPVFSVKYLLSIPDKVSLRSLRNDLETFSDNLNIDTILNPIKH